MKHPNKLISERMCKNTVSITNILELNNCLDVLGCGVFLFVSVGN